MEKISAFFRVFDLSMFFICDVSWFLEFAQGSHHTHIVGFYFLIQGSLAIRRFI